MPKLSIKDLKTLTEATASKGDVVHTEYRVAYSPDPSFKNQDLIYFSGVHDSLPVALKDAQRQARNAEIQRKPNGSNTNGKPRYQNATTRIIRLLEAFWSKSLKALGIECQGDIIPISEGITRVQCIEDERPSEISIGLSETSPNVTN
jgi:hypothetical protein